MKSQIALNTASEQTLMLQRELEKCHVLLKEKEGELASTLLAIKPKITPEPTAEERRKLEEQINILQTEKDTLDAENHAFQQAIKIKDKMLDDQNESIRDLKQKISEKVFTRLFLMLYTFQMAENCLNLERRASKEKQLEEQVSGLKIEIKELQNDVFLFL